MTITSDKYGYLKRNSLGLSSNQFEFSAQTDLQSDGDSSVIGSSYVGFPIASFEQDRYQLKTSSKNNYELAGDTPAGFISLNQSDSEGNLKYFGFRAEAKNGVYVSQNGLTITSANFIEELRVFTYRDGQSIGTFTLTGADSVKTDLGYKKKQAFFVELDKINRIEIFVNKIDKPYNFFYLIDFSVSIEEDMREDVLMSVDSINRFSLYGETLEYSTLDFEVLNGEHERIFRKNESIEMIDVNGQSSNFFTRESTDTGYSDIVNCSDFVSLLESQFLGGMYINKNATIVIDECIGQGLSRYFSFSPSLMSENISGYIPVCTKREALQQILISLNARMFKGDGVEFFSKLENKLNSFVYDETKVLENPQITRSEPLKKVIVRQHNYSKNTEPFEIYNHTAVKGSRILLNEPIWNVSVSISSDGGKNYGDVTASVAKTYFDYYTNYIVFKKNIPDSLLKIQAMGYTDSVVEYVKENSQTVKNEDYLTKVVDLYIHADAQAVCDLLYELYSRPYSIVFLTLHKPELGGYYNILGHNLNVCSIRDMMNGVYEVEAR